MVDRVEFHPQEDKWRTFVQNACHAVERAVAAKDAMLTPETRIELLAHGRGQGLQVGIVADEELEVFVRPGSSSKLGPIVARVFATPGISRDQARLAARSYA
ncbi:hypothetical protein [Sphingomonas sp. Leaf38]|uniref:hypothetical protein n=1 Tax=Sphingomonas sp. Leaf38 TaxID=1736217 RepID=UPI000B1C3342|nr:hypothetical protein [Sphingomonas sp. Leaf38]